jgi:hypothetical protein
MNNPAIFFYAKVLQYFSYAGIKVINVHAQTSFIFSATLYFYFLEVVKLLGMEFNLPLKIAVLLVGPTINLISYYYFNNDKRENILFDLLAKEKEGQKLVSNLLTAAFILPMVIFFTLTVFR